MDEPTDWSGVRDRVVAVALAEARARRWPPSQVPVLSPVLSADEIAEAEAQFGVALPEEYRSFLSQVGAGGQGPKILLTTLRKIEGKWGWFSEDDERHPFTPDTSGPFIESRDWVDAQVAALRAAGREPTVRDDETDYLDDYQSAFGEVDGEELWYRQRSRGAVYISDNGCGMTGWLIVVGPHRGEVRDRDCDLNPPFEPYFDARGDRHTFRSWYVEWLERREAEFAQDLALS
ncbi:SMI1/KNR4 family protein [Actinospica durhamensis]|uniref:SMI1/KNR4 family protein n=1 Tax=Actinospica durhamensis TaxID=1508375 RepID=A0A941IVA5_9ACTN|nr:SMI1/KNR4 family protein [Actinospica durhamensis]MBR7836786.1 SMI1/KNR4 family protein [Actinospica durhamensis]